MATGQYRKPELISAPVEPIKYQYKSFSPNMAALNKVLKKDGIITHEKAPFFDQGTLNAYCRREFLIRTREGFVPSDLWFRAIQEHDHAVIVKDHPSENLGKYVSMLQTVRSMRGAA